jgi:transposase
MRRRCVRPLSDEEREEVTRVYRSSTTADLVRRCHAVSLCANGQPIPAIAQMLRVDQSVIHRWLDRCEGGGVAALAPQERAGRPPRWDEPYEVALVETVRHDPRCMAWNTRGGPVPSWPDTWRSRPALH